MIELKGLFNFSDRLQMAALDQRVTKSQVLHGNIANAETPGFRAIGYEFEEQLRDIYGATEEGLALEVTHPEHKKQPFANANGEMTPDVFVRPSESVGHDGNTVDVDIEMQELAENQILYRATIESINKKIAMIRYAIHGGRG